MRICLAVVRVARVRPPRRRLLPQVLPADLNHQLEVPELNQDISRPLQAVRPELREELLLPQESQAVRRLAAPVAVVVHTSLQSLAWPEPLAVSLAAGEAVVLPPTTASRLALAVLAAAARSSSSPTANL